MSKFIKFKQVIAGQVSPKMIWLSTDAILSVRDDTLGSGDSLVTLATGLTITVQGNAADVVKALS